MIAQARTWVEQVRARVAANEHPCLHPADPRVLLVGGNHDVDWGKATDPDQHARHRPFAAAFADLPHPYLEQPLVTRNCAPILYRDAKVAFWLLGSAELGGEQLADPHSRAVFTLTEGLATDDGSRVALETHRPRLERIDPGLVAQHALDAAAPPDSVPVRIAVLHHPVTALAGAAPEVASFTGLINAATVKAALRQKGYQLVLHGHLHHGALVTETSHDKGGAPDLHGSLPADPRQKSPVLIRKARGLVPAQRNRGGGVVLGFVPKLDFSGSAPRIVQVSEAIRVDEQVSERLTWKQICERYPDEWVVLVDTQWVNDTDFEFGTAIVLGHFTSRRQASPHIKVAFQHYTKVGSFWTGAIRSPIPRFVLP